MTLSLSLPLSYILSLSLSVKGLTLNPLELVSRAGDIIDRVPETNCVSGQFQDRKDILLFLFFLNAW